MSPRSCPTNSSLPRALTSLMFLAAVVTRAAPAPSEPSLAPELDVYVIKPITGFKILPDTFPFPGSKSDRISLAATPGEYEPAGLVLRPNTDLTDLRIQTHHLKSRNGRTIPAECIDIKVVKCWYQATTAWTGIHTRPKEAGKVRVPELLLNDDRLVRVDRDEQKNYLNVPCADGRKYVWISDPEEPDGDKMKILSVEDYPIADSPNLLPVDIPAQTNKQLWITVAVPQSAHPGIYESPVEFACKETVLASVTLAVKVLPFRLAAPKTHYDISKDFESSIYYRGKLHKDRAAGSISSEHKSRSQLRAELYDMFVHGITNPTCYQPFDPGLLAEYLTFRNEIGMRGKPLYYLGVSANSDPAAIKKLLSFATPYGVPDVYFYGIDEASGDRLKAQRNAWQATRRAGGKVFVAGGRNRNFDAMGDIQDLHICAGPPSREEAAKWHSVGHKVFCYANPQGGPENPETWRRNYGLSLWLADYDGACTYCYQHSFGSIWNDFDHYHYRDHILAYPTLDGVIDTIALEGYREAIDDIRYAVTLRLRIAKAKTSSRAEVRDSASEAEKWLSQLDPAPQDLDHIRSEMIDRILGLPE
jgi:hypothetical protein